MKYKSCSYETSNSNEGPLNHVLCTAPPGCLQYFYETFGMVQSFNYGRDYYGDTQYAICFNRGKKVNANLL